MQKALSALALAIAMALVVSPTTPARAESLPAYPFAHVSGSAFTGVMPDIGAIDFEIVAQDADPAAARAVLDARVGEVNALMKEVGLDPDDVAVREIRQSVRKDPPAPPGAPVYELRCDVHVNVRNLANWRALAGGLLGKPNLDGFASSFDLLDADKVTDELAAQAVMSARRRAGVLAAAEGRRLGPLMAVTPGELKNLTTAMGLQRAEFFPRGAAGAGTTPIDGEALLVVRALKLQVGVDAIFRLDGSAAPAKRQK